MSPKALPHLKGDVVTLTPDLLKEGLVASRASSRRRIILPVQRDQNACVQRLLNFMQPGTYIRPHRHPEPHATESICLIQGQLEVLIFSTDGDVQSRHLLTPSSPLIDIEPDVWHGMIVREEDTVVFEVKQGPYLAIADKDFARWAPEEGTESTERFLAQLTDDL